MIYWQKWENWDEQIFSITRQISNITFACMNLISFFVQIKSFEYFVCLSKMLENERDKQRKKAFSLIVI